MPPTFTRLFAILLSFSASAGHAIAAGGSRAAAPPELVVIHKTQVLPSTDASESADHFQVSLGRVLAAAMGRPVRFLDLPRNRFVTALEAGKGDILCGYIPTWISGEMDWSRPFIPVTEVLVSSARAAAPHAIEDLKGKRIGTVLGFRYPDVERVLGGDFVRDDAPSESMSLAKMVAGRFDYAITTKATIHSQTLRGGLPANLNILVLKDFRTMCAVSRHGHVSTAEVNAAIDRIERNGELDKLLSAR